MDRRPLALAALVLATACAGRTPAPARPTAAAAVPAVPVAPRDPTTLAYAAVNARYRIEGATHVVQEVMGQVNSSDVTSRQVVSAVVSQNAGNLAFALTIDSIDVTDPVGATAGLAAAARGQTFQLVVSPSGLVISTAAPDSTNPLMRQISAGLGDFLPRLPAVSATAGQAWTDTVTRTAGQAGVATRMVRQHRVVGWEDRDGARALHVTMTSNYSVSGSTEAQGQQIELNGNGLSTRESFISAAGVFLGSVESDSALINAVVTAMGLTVPVRQTRRSTVTRIP